MTFRGSAELRERDTRREQSPLWARQGKRAAQRASKASLKRARTSRTRRRPPPRVSLRHSLQSTSGKNVSPAGSASTCVSSRRSASGSASAYTPGAADDEHLVVDGSGHFESLVDAGRNQYAVGARRPVRGAGDDDRRPIGQRTTDRLVRPPAHDEDVPRRQLLEAPHVAGEAPGQSPVDPDHAVPRHGSDERDGHLRRLRRRSARGSPGAGRIRRPAPSRDRTRRGHGTRGRAGARAAGGARAPAARAPGRRG